MYVSAVMITGSIVDSHSFGVRQNLMLCNFVLPGPIITKLDMIDYVGDPYSDASFSKIWLSGEFPASR